MRRLDAPDISLLRLAWMTGRPAFVLAVFVSLFMQPIAGRAAYVIRSRDVGGTTYVHLKDVAGYYGMKIHRDKKHLVLAGNGRRLDLWLKSRTGYIDGYKVNLSFSPLEHQQALLLAERDLTLLVDPQWRGWGLPRKNLGTIVIDPGHGGKDPGAVGNGLNEKDVALAVGLKLRAILQEQGYRVIMTRSDDRFITLAKRGRFKGDVFVSLHCNSARAAAAAGFETWYCAPAGTNSTRTAGLMYKEKVDGNRNDRLNQRLAYEIQRYTLHATGQKQDRGLRRARFQVLRQAQVPAVLVEMGFISNRAEAENLNSNAYRQKLAQGIANGIIAFHRTVAPTTE